MMKYLLILITMSFVSKSFGQLQFEEISIDNISSIINPTSGNKKLIFINSSNNGMIDLLMNTSNNETLFFRNTGNNIFSIDTSLTIDSRITHIIDFDFDNDLDIISHPSNPNNHLIFVNINDGNGNFTNTSSIPNFCGFICLSSHSLADVTNDMKMDFVSSAFIEFTDSGWTEQQFLVNNGDDTFTQSNSNITEFITGELGVQFIDFDNDGDFDIYTNGTTINGYTGYNPISRFFINDGNGVFSIVIDSTLPNNYRVYFEDFNGDGIIDAFSNNNVFINDGFGNFLNTFNFPNLNTDLTNILLHIDFGDINNDNVTDILLTKGQRTGTWGNFSYINIQTKLYLNDGFGNFNSITNLPFEDFRITSSDIADIDSNGNKEIIIHALDEANNEVTKLYTVNSSLSIGENEFDTNITILPNPSNNYFSLNSREELQLNSVNIYNTNGQLVKNDSDKEILARKIFDVSTLSKGVYIIEIKLNEVNIYKKLIKQ